MALQGLWAAKPQPVFPFKNKYLYTYVSRRIDIELRHTLIISDQLRSSRGTPIPPLFRVHTRNTKHQSLNAIR